MNRTHVGWVGSSMFHSCCFALCWTEWHCTQPEMREHTIRLPICNGTATTICMRYKQYLNHNTSLLHCDVCCSSKSAASITNCPRKVRITHGPLHTGPCSQDAGKRGGVAQVEKRDDEQAMESYSGKHHIFFPPRSITYYLYRAPPSSPAPARLPWRFRARYRVSAMHAPGNTPTKTVVTFSQISRRNRPATA